MHELDYTGIGKRIRALRRERGWSQETLAKRCGVSLSFIGHIERGTRIMSLDTFAAICIALSADADGLLWGIVPSQAAGLKEVWGQKTNQNPDSYEIYTKIMKSVAEIMGES